MPRPKTKKVISFALRFDTIDRLKEVAAEAQIHGGASAIIQDSADAWLRRYKADPKAWLLQRGISAVGTPMDDDI